MEKLNLIRGLKKSDTEAFDKIFEGLFPHLWRYATKILNDETEAEDIVLESFAKFYARRTEFESMDSIRMFLFTITRNACISYLRSLKAAANYKHHLLSSDWVDDDQWLDEVDYQAQLMTILYEEVNKLPKKRKRIFELYYFNHHSYKEIARSLNLSESAVRAHVSNALKTIRMIILHKELLLILLLPF